MMMAASSVESSYVHLGSVRHADASLYHPIDARITAVTRIFGALKTVFRSSYAHLHTKNRVYVGAVLPVLLYGCEYSTDSLYSTTVAFGASVASTVARFVKAASPPSSAQTPLTTS